MEMALLEEMALEMVVVVFGAGIALGFLFYSIEFLVNWLLKE